MIKIIKKLKEFILDYILGPKVSIFLYHIYTKIKNYAKPNDVEVNLYESDRWELWRENLNDIQNYFEYGVGSSTLYVAKNFSCTISGVDTDKKWINEVNFKSNRRIELEHIDLGEVGNWGTPISYENWKIFTRYISPKKLNIVEADMVLVDGRFRVACFLNVLKVCKSGTKVIFDDYPKRKHYHIVERFIQPKKVNAYQALFEIPDSLDKKDINNWIENFYFVME